VVERAKLMKFTKCKLKKIVVNWFLRFEPGKCMYASAVVSKSV
jgi:hypothetical protein